MEELDSLNRPLRAGGSVKRGDTLTEMRHAVLLGNTVYAHEPGSMCTVECWPIPSGKFKFILREDNVDDAQANRAWAEWSQAQVSGKPRRVGSFKAYLAREQPVEEVKDYLGRPLKRGDIVVPADTLEGLKLKASNDTTLSYIAYAQQRSDGLCYSSNTSRWRYMLRSMSAEDKKANREWAQGKDSPPATINDYLGRPLTRGDRVVYADDVRSLALRAESDITSRAHFTGETGTPEYPFGVSGVKWRYVLRESTEQDKEGNKAWARQLQGEEKPQVNSIRWACALPSMSEEDKAANRKWAQQWAQQWAQGNSASCPIAHPVPLYDGLSPLHAAALALLRE